MSVVVVGAGASGLACAHTLASAGVPVEVFEASAHIGGRVRTWVGDDGEVWELGAQVVHAAGVDVLSSMVPDAVPAPHGDFGLSVYGRLLPAWKAGLLGIRPWELAGRLPVGPADRAVAAWLAEAVPAGPAREVGRAWFEQEWACPASALSVPDVAAWTADRAVDGVECTVPQGMSTVVEHLAAGLTVHTGAPVGSVSVTASGPVVRTDEATLRPDAVVVTVPPWTLRAKAQGRPGLVLDGVCAADLAAAAGLPVGDGVAAVVTWSHPAPADVTVFDGAGVGFLRARAGSATLQLVSKGPAASVLRRVLGLPAELAAVLSRALPWTAGGSAADVAVADWGHDPWIRGSFSAPSLRHGAARVALARLEGGGLYVAGEAARLDGTAARLHGAVLSGIAAARKILDPTGTADRSHQRHASLV